MLLLIGLLVLLLVFFGYAWMSKRVAHSSVTHDIQHTPPSFWKHVSLTALGVGLISWIRWKSLSFPPDVWMLMNWISPRLFVLLIVLSLFSIGLIWMSYRGRYYMRKVASGSFLKAYGYAFVAVMLGCCALLICFELQVLLFLAPYPRGWYVIPLTYELVIGTLFALPVAIMIKSKAHKST